MVPDFVFYCAVSQWVQAQPAGMLRGWGEAIAATHKGNSKRFSADEDPNRSDLWRLGSCAIARLASGTGHRPGRQQVAVGPADRR